MIVVRKQDEQRVLDYDELNRESIYEANADTEDPDWDFGLFILVDDGQIVDVVNHTIYGEEDVRDWEFREVKGEIVVAE